MYEETLTALMERATPQSAEAMRLGYRLLDEYNNDAFISDIESMFLNIENVPSVGDFLLLLELHVRKVAVSIGLEFSDDSSVLHMVTRIGMLEKMVMPETYEYVEDPYSRFFMNEFATTMNYELDRLISIKDYHELRIDMEGESFMEDKNNLDTGFVRAFVRFTAISRNEVPPMLKGIRDVDDFDMEIFMGGITELKMPAVKTAEAILLMTILDPYYRKVSPVERAETFTIFKDKIPPVNRATVRGLFRGLITKYHMMEP